MIDLHCHILPVVDDGAHSWDEAIQMARHACDDGITDIVATPHTHNGIYVNHRKHVMAQVKEFQDQLDQLGIPLQLYPGTEIHLHLELLDNLATGEILSLADEKKYALIELPRYHLPTCTDDMLYELTMNGITPIICHPERNRYLQDHTDRLVAWINQGAIMQVTAGSVIGSMGRRVKRLTEWMIRHNLVHVIASDGHNMAGRKPELRAAYDYLRKQHAETSERLRRNAELILRGEPCEVPEPIQPRNRRNLFFIQNFLRRR